MDLRLRLLQIDEPISATLFQARNPPLSTDHLPNFHDHNDYISDDLPSRNRVPDTSSLRVRPVTRAWLSQARAGAGETAETMVAEPNANALQLTGIIQQTQPSTVHAAQTVPQITTPATQPNGTTHATILEWRDYIQEAIASEAEDNRAGRPPILCWRAEGESVDVLARLLTSFVYAKLSHGTVNIFSFPDGTRLGISAANSGSELMLQSLFRNTRLYKV